MILCDGELALYLERGGRSLLTYAPFEDDAVAAASIEALGGLLRDGRLRHLQIERIDGIAMAGSPHRQRLEALGFRQAYRGFVLSPAPAALGTLGAPGWRLQLDEPEEDPGLPKHGMARRGQPLG